MPDAIHLIVFDKLPRSNRLVAFHAIPTMAVVGEGRDELEARHLPNNALAWIPIPHHAVGPVNDDDVSTTTWRSSVLEPIRIHHHSFIVLCDQQSEGGQAGGEQRGFRVVKHKEAQQRPRNGQGDGAESQRSVTHNEHQHGSQLQTGHALKVSWCLVGHSTCRG